MDPQKRQAELDGITDEQIARIKPEMLIEDDTDMVVTEFALRFGWEAYKEYREDIISTKEMNMLLNCARKLDNAERYYNAESAFIGSYAAQSDKPGNTFTTLTSKLKGE